jgi:hypothetical protein
MVETNAEHERDPDVLGSVSDSRHSIGVGMARDAWNPQREVTMASQSAVFIGIKGTVLALDSATGVELWRTELKGMDFVNVAVLDGTVYAATKGELFALDPATGTKLWRNKLKGLGLGFVTIAGAGQVPAAASRQRRQQGAAAAATAAAASG